MNVVDQPPRHKPKLSGAPRIMQIYMCQYPPAEHQHLPEFWKTRPVVILSRKSTLSGVATVVPLTSRSQDDDRFSVYVRSPLDGRDAWAICNHITTVAVSRLAPPHKRAVPKMEAEDFQKIVQK